MMDIVYIGNAAYAAAIRVSAESALRRASNRADVRIHIVTNDPDFPNMGYDVRRWTGVGRTGWHGTELVWSRIDFVELFPECDWIVSCDADTLWLADPLELFALRDECFIMQASRDATGPDGSPLGEYGWWADNGLEILPEKCYCCGLMILNLRKMRKEGFSAACHRFIEEYPDPPMREQSVMCYVARNASAPLPPGWGVFSFWHTNVYRPSLVHYVQDLPWQRDKINRLVSDIVLLWWHECERIGLSNEFRGFRGCRGKVDYVCRRLLYVLMRPFAGFIDRVSWLKPHFRNARGLRGIDFSTDSCLHVCAGWEKWNGAAVVAEMLLRERLIGGRIGERRIWVSATKLKAVDEVWVHCAWKPCLWWAALWAKKLVWMPHGSYDPVRLGYHGWKKWLASPIERLFLRRADVVVATCQAEADWIRGYEPRVKKVEITDLKRFFRLPQDGKPGLDCSKPVHLLYLGRKHPLKGIEYLEQAVAGLTAVELRIVSDAEEEELKRVWQWCEVLVLPTLSENFGLVVAEALERGKMVITTDGAPAWGDGNDYGGRLIYLKGYRLASPSTRVRLLKEAIEKICK